MKKYFIFTVLFGCLLGSSAMAALDPPTTSAKSMIVIHANSGEILAEHNSNQPMLIASTTKIMTALVALENLDLNREVTIDSAWTKVEGSSMYLRAGECYTVRDLLYGLMLASGNDAAVALACTAADSPEAFAELMNRKARDLNLYNTHFSNPHGLDEEGHRSSARDLAILMAEAMKNEEFAKITSERNYSTHGVTYVNHNKLLWRCKGINGGKTGFTKAAGRCLVSSCERDGLSLICVTLSDGNDWADHSALYEWAFEQYVQLLIPAGFPVETVPVISEESVDIQVCVEEDVSLCIPRGSAVESKIALPRFVFPTVRQGDEAGNITIVVNGIKKGIWPLLWSETVLSPKDSRKTTIKNIGQSILGVYYMK